MRVAIVAESFLPERNGVSGTVLRIVEQLEATEHSATVIAAGAGAPRTVGRTPVIGLPSVGFPGYPQVRLALVRQRRMTEILRGIAPDVVHLASPILLGHVAAKAAVAAGLPIVAAFQTDVAGFAAHYGARSAATRIWSRITDIHRMADLTLAPSAHSEKMLRSHGIQRLRRWERGVDHDLFHPARRRRSDPGDAMIRVGYAGRLAPEKQLGLLRVLTDIPGVQLVLIGDGPERAALERDLPGAHLIGQLSGSALATAIADLDIFVHPGQNETYCQGVQEALACGVPAVVVAAGAVQERITPGLNGWRFQPGDQAELVAAVQDLLHNPLRRAAFGLAAAASVADRRWSVLGEELLAHYADVVRNRRVQRMAA